MGRRPAMGALAALSIALSIVVSSGCGPSYPAKTFIVAGTVELTGQSGWVVGQPCAGSGNDADLRDGAEVVVSGPDGRLGVGHLVDAVGTAENGMVSCVWKFFVPDVDADSPYYEVEVSGRGPHRYDTSAIHGRVDLSVPAR